MCQQDVFRFFCVYKGRVVAFWDVLGTYVDVRSALMDLLTTTATQVPVPADRDKVDHQLGRHLHPQQRSGHSHPAPALAPRSGL